jgi:hypothetical protein
MPGEQAAATLSVGIVHGALRRDLARIRTALTAAPCPQGRQRAAIAAHAGWMMTFLDGHHGGEDAGLWPAVRAKNATLRRRRRRREDLLAAVGLLEQTLLPHLRREEREMMPVVARTLSRAELDAIEQAFFIRPKTKGAARRRGAVAHRQRRRAGAAAHPRRRAGAAAVRARPRLRPALPAQPAAAVGRRTGSSHPAPARGQHGGDRLMDKTRRLRPACTGPMPQESRW